VTIVTTDPIEDRIPFEDVLPGKNAGASARGSTYWGRVQSCPREHLLGNLMRWEPIPRAHALDFGLLWHHCLERYYRTMWAQQLGQSTPKTPEREAFEALQPFRSPPGWGEIYEKIGRMLDSYFSRWQNADRYWQIMGVECLIQLPAHLEQQYGFPYTARLDLLIVDHTGTFPVGRSIEHKSAWRMEPNLLTGYSQDDQVIGQVFLNRFVDWRALNVYYGGALVNITTKTKDPTNERIPVLPSEDQFSSWAQHKKYWANFQKNLEFTAWADGDSWETISEREPLAHEMFPKNYKSCIRRFGRCAYFDFCRNHPAENLVQIRQRHQTNDLPDRYRKQGFTPEGSE